MDSYGKGRVNIWYIDLIGYGKQIRTNSQMDSSQMIGQFLASMGGHHIVTSQTLVAESLGVLALSHSNCMRDCNLMNISIKKQEGCQDTKH